MGRIIQIAFATTTVDVALVTNGSAKILSVSGIAIPKKIRNALILGWAQVTTGTNTTGIACRVLRVPPAAFTELQEANTRTIVAAVGSTQQVFRVAKEQYPAVSQIEYDLFVTQIGATGNGTVLQAGILVILY